MAGGYPFCQIYFRHHPGLEESEAVDIGSRRAVAGKADDAVVDGGSPDRITSAGMTGGVPAGFRDRVVRAAVLEHNVPRPVDVILRLNVSYLAHASGRDAGGMAIGAGTIDDGRGMALVTGEVSFGVSGV